MANVTVELCDEIINRIVIEDLVSVRDSIAANIERMNSQSIRDEEIECVNAINKVLELYGHNSLTPDEALDELARLGQEMEK